MVSPVLIGAVTVLVIIVAVFLAYNANNGLPFVPSYRIHAELPDAASLVKGNDVRMGGARIGVVESMKPLLHDDGSATAEVTLKLDKTVEPLPKDSTIMVRPRSAIGLKYVQITRGHPASGGIPNGGHMPLSNAKPHPVEMDDFFNTFDKATRIAMRGNLVEFGNAITGRGQALNRTIGALNPLLVNLIPVMRNLAAPSTQLQRFFAAMGRAAAEAAPVAETQADLFRSLDKTFIAWASVARPYLQDTITGGPPALDQAIHSFPIQRRFMANAEGFFHELRPGIVALRKAAPALANAFTIGTPALERATKLNDQLRETFAKLQDFSSDPLVPLALQRLTQTGEALAPTAAALAPAQTVCNYFGTLMRNASSAFSDGIAGSGTWMRVGILVTEPGLNLETGPSAGPANTPGIDVLHSNPYPNVGQGPNPTCTAANEKYLPGVQTSNPPSRFPATTHEDTHEKDYEVR